MKCDKNVSFNCDFSAEKRKKYCETGSALHMNLIMSLFVRH